MTDVVIRVENVLRNTALVSSGMGFIGGTPEPVGTIARIIGRNGAGKVEDLIDAGDAIISIATGFEYGNAPAENIGFGANTVASMVS